MNGFEEFMAFIAKRAEKKNEAPEMGGVKTTDGKEINSNGVESVMMLLSGCSIEQIKRFGKHDLFVRLAENFIKANTKEDIDHFIAHNVALKMTNLIFR